MVEKFKKFSISINSTFYEFGRGGLPSKIKDFENACIKFFSPLGWILKIEEKMCGTSQQLKHPDYNEVCYIYLHPLEIVAIVPIDKENEFLDYVLEHKEDLIDFGEIEKGWITTEDVYTFTMEEQVEYLMSKEEKLIEIIKNHKPNTGDLEMKLLNERLWDVRGGCFGYCTENDDYKYIHSLVEKYGKNK